MSRRLETDSYGISSAGEAETTDSNEHRARNFLTLSIEVREIQ